jgi:hypothetical protein
MIMSDDLVKISAGHERVRFYGDTITAEYAINPPFKFYEVPADLCARVADAFPEYTQLISSSFIVTDFFSITSISIFFSPA